MDYLVRNWTFVAFAGLLCLINLFLMSDVALIWAGAETQIVERAQAGESGLILVDLARISGAADNLSGLGLRLPSIVWLFLAMAVFFLLGRRLFGKNTILHGLLVLLSTFGLSTLGHFGSGDAWLLAIHFIGILGVIAFLKKPGAPYRLLVYGAMLLSIWLDPISSLLLWILFPVALVFIHPQGRRLIQLHPWFFAGVSVLALYLTDGLNWLAPGQYLGWGRTPWWVFASGAILSALPFLGFFGAGLWDSIQKIRKREEWSILVLSWVVICLLVQSPAVLGGIALLTGKHLSDYFRKNYPHGNIVKTIMLLHLVGFFFVATLLMLGGFFEFRGTGFRSGMAFSAVYWMLSLAAVIGLYGYNRRFVLGGMALAGLLATSLFWLQLFPLWEGRRVARVVVDQLDQVGTNRTDVLVDSTWLKGPSSLSLYLKKAGKNPVTEVGDDLPEIVLGSLDYAEHRSQQDTLKVITDQLRSDQLIISYGPVAQ